MKNLFRPLLVLTGCIVLASCVSQKQFKGLKLIIQSCKQNIRKVNCS